MTPMKWFWGFLRKYRFKLLGGLILTTFISVLAIVNPYVSGMMVIKEMQVLDPNGKTYICTLQSGEYKLVNPPSEAASIFTEM